MSDIAIKAEHLSKYYRLGVINNGTLFRDIQTWLALKRGKQDPHSKIGEHKYKGTDEGFWALKDLNFEIKQGDRVGIIGKNGAGKSTLLKILSRITAPTEGCVKIHGRVASLLEVGTGFHGELTGRENVYLNGAILGMKKREVDRKIDEIIDFSGIEKHIDTPVKRYSSGMYVRLAFAVAAHLDSEILIADEVLAVGDVAFQKKALGKMNELSTGQGRTVLFVSHNMTMVRKLCDKGIFLETGKIKYDGDIENGIKLYLEKHPANLKTHYNFDGQPRSFLDRGTNFIIHDFYLLDKENAQFLSTEPMKFRINIEAKHNFENLRIRLEIRTLDETNVGMSESKPLFSIHAGESKVLDFCFNISNLAEGTYTLRLTIFELNQLGLHKGFDETTELIYFEVIESELDRTNWLPQYWGHVKLSPVQSLL